MEQEIVTLEVEKIIWREELYPRVKRDPALAQRYSEDLEVLPPIEVNQKGELIDGWHRWTAHKAAKAKTIEAFVTETSSDIHLLALAARRNARFGWQLDVQSKKHTAIALFQRGAGFEPGHASQEVIDEKTGEVSKENEKARLVRVKADIADALGVTERAVNGYLSDIEGDLRKERSAAIFDMWLACHTREEIAAAHGVSEGEVTATHEEASKSEDLPNLTKLPDGRTGKAADQAARYGGPDWKPPLFDIWSPAKNSNEVAYFGNTPVEFVDNLLYTFTRPFEVVIDPFAGGGSTIDICRERLRRYWVSDRLPIEARKDEIRQHDLATGGVSGPSRWGDVALVYLDPPYWKQAEGKYSSDPTDLANMPLDEFTKTLVDIIHGYAGKLRAGAHVACIISPTQWPNEDKSTVYHDLDLARLVGKKLKLVRRVVCPYSTEQYNGTQVNIAKEQRLWLVLSRTLLVWERV